MTTTTTRSFDVRPAAPGDLERVRQLLRAAALPEDGLEDQFGDRYAVAVASDRLVGVEGIEVHGRDGLLRSAAVSPDWRGRGVGDALTRDRIDWSRRQQLDALYLLTTTAAQYFPRFGFTEAARESAPPAIQASREFADACPASATFMRLPLRSPENLS